MTLSLLTVRVKAVERFDVRQCGGSSSQRPHVVRVHGRCRPTAASTSVGVVVFIAIQRRVATVVGRSRQTERRRRVDQVLLHV